MRPWLCTLALAIRYPRRLHGTPRSWWRPPCRFCCLEPPGGRELESDGHDAGAWVIHEIRSEDARDRARSAQIRDRRRRRQERLQQGRAYACHEVKNEKSEVAERVLDVVAEDPEEKHVSEGVRKASVQEHRGEYRHDRV